MKLFTQSRISGGCSMRTRIPYIITALAVLSICVWIFFCSRGFIRYHGGDFCIVILIYAAIKSVFHTAPPCAAGSGIFLLAAAVEFLQSGIIPAYFDTSSRLIAATLGSTFDWIDLLAYLCGAITVSLADRFLLMKLPRR
jgi:hypothetical protein